MGADKAVLGGDSWVSALRELPDNPLAAMLLAARKSRIRRLPLIRRLWLLWVCLAVPALAGGLELAGNSWFQHVDLEGQVPILIVGAWLAEWFYSVSLDALALLGGGGRFQLDDMLAVSSMSSRVIVLGFLKASLPGLLQRLAVLLVFAWIGTISTIQLNSGTFLYWAANGQAAMSPSTDMHDSPLTLSNEGSFHWRNGMAEIVRLSRLKPAELVFSLLGRVMPGTALVAFVALISAIILGLQALLAGTCFVLVQISLGRGRGGFFSQQLQTIFPLAAFVAYGWLSWTALNAGNYSAQGIGSAGTGVLIASAVFAVSLLTMSLSLARDNAWLRQLVWPLLILLGGLSILNIGDLRHSQLPGQVLSSVFWACGMLAPVNVLAVPAPLAWAQLQYVGTPPPELFSPQYPILLLSQLLLLALLLTQAQESVELQRLQPH